MPRKSSPLFQLTDSSVRIGRQIRPMEVALEMPGDKSISHRSLLLASLASEPVRIEGLLGSADVGSTLAAIRKLGARARRTGESDCWMIQGRGIEGYREAEGPIDCGNSGTTVRLLTGLLAASPMFSIVTGDSSLRRRPMARVVRPLAAAGATLLGRDGGRLLPLAIQGCRMNAFDCEIPEPSAQVKTAMLLAAMKSSGVSRITQESRTRDHTERMFRYLGVPLTKRGATLEVTGPAEPRARELQVPGDPSSAAFFAVAALAVPGSRIEIRRVCLNPTRIGFVKVLQRMGASIQIRKTGEACGETIGDLITEHGPLRGVVVRAAEIPSLVDEVPVLAVAACLAEGLTRFRGISELRTKETDRVAALVREFSAMGAAIEAIDDDLIVRGPSPLTGASVESHHDHRMAMSLSVAALAASGVTEILGHRCVKISFPHFFDQLAEISGRTAQ